MKFLFLLFLALSYNTRRKVERLLTVIIPCYKCERWLHETLEGVYKQTIIDSLDIILVDDGSWTSHGNKPGLSIKRHLWNRGLSAARNTGARSAKTKYIAFLDPDDLIAPFTLERLLIAQQDANTYRRSRHIAFTFPSVTQFNGSSVILRSGAEFHPRLLFDPRPQPHAPPSFAIIDAAVYRAAGGMNGLVRTWEDLEFWGRLYRAGYSGLWWPEDDLFWYRRHEGSRSKQFVKELGEDRARLEAISMGKHAIVDAPQLYRSTVKYPQSKAECQVLFVIPWMERGGADDYDLEVLRVLTLHNFTACVMTTHSDIARHRPQEPRYRQYTADIWHAGRLSIDTDFLEYLMETRRPRHVWIRNTMVGYEMSKLYPHAASFIDILHLDTPQDSLGFEHSSASFAPFLHARIVVSRRLARIIPGSLVIPPPINTTFWKCATSETASSPRLLFVGRFDEQKRPNLFISLCRQLPEATCTMVVDRVDDSIAHLPGNVKMLRWMEPERLWRLMCVHDALVLTSKNEGVPVVGLQAAACGLPVLSLGRVGAVSEIPGVREFDHMDDLCEYVKNGRLSRLENITLDGIEEFENKILSLFRLKDKEVR